MSASVVPTLTHTSMSGGEALLYQYRKKQTERDYSRAISACSNRRLTS